MSRQLIAESYRSVLYLEHRDTGVVVLKLLKPEHTNASSLMRFNNELRIASSLQVPGVRKVLRKVLVDGKHGLELEYVPGSAPETGPVSSDSDLLRALDCARQLCRILVDVHGAGVVHRDVKPGNLVVDGDARVTLIDFGCATRIAHRDSDGLTANVLEGTLAYMSPEQTGRMNRSVDSRSDLYAVGVTLFELLSGRVPFASDDPMEVVHGHIARRPPRLAEEEGVPAAVADLVDHLLRKDADARYQTAAGVVADLDLCIEGLSSGALEPFALARNDRRTTFRISERLYGRAVEVSQLLKSFEGAGQGVAELVLISGFSGVGKSKLVREVDPVIVRHRGHFIAGKFERLHRSTPYYGFIQALTQLAEQILTQSQVELDAWRHKLLDAVGELGGVVIRLVPAFEAVIGPQPDVPELGPDETRSRFSFVISAFVRACCSPERPLVLFLDDLQWADFAALDLLETLMAEPLGQALLVLGAYRDDEVDAAHPLSLMAGRLTASGTPIGRIQLKPLTEADVEELLADTLNTQGDAVSRLAALTVSKTGGNPFFVRQFLEQVHRRGLIRHDGAQWQLDVAEIARLAITENVADLLSTALHELPEDARSLIQLAACIGARVAVRQLARVRDDDPLAVIQQIWPAVQRGYLLPTDRLLGAALDELSTEIAQEITLVFSHDRVQQAAYALANEAQRAEHHLQIGRTLLAHTHTDHGLFDVVNHLNLAGDRFDDAAALGRLNLRAGELACLSAAHQQGLAHYDVAAALLDTEPWGPERLAVHTGAAKAAYQVGALDRALAACEVVLAHTQDALERVSVHRVRLMCAVAEDDLSTAQRYGLLALEELGESFPSKPIGPHIGVALVQVKWALWGKDVASLASEPEMRSPEKREAMWVLEKVLPAAFRASSPHFPLFVMRLVQLTLRHGVSPVASFAYAGYAIMLAGILGDVRAAHQFGQLSLTLSERDAHQFAALRSKALFVFNNMVRHWTEPLQNCVPGLARAYRYGLESGAVFDTVWASFYRITWMFVTGAELATVAQELADYRSVHAQDAGAAQEAALLEQIVHNLRRSDLDAPHSLQGPHCDDAQISARMAITDDRTEAVITHFFRGWLCNLFGQHDEALSHLSRAESELEAVVALPFVPLIHLEVNLARCGVLQNGGKCSLTKAHRAVKSLKKWAVDSPENYRHKHAWLQAELAWQSGKLGLARDCFQTALNAARTSGWRHEEARILERAQRFYKQTDDAVLAEALRERATVAYRAWGATAKVEQLMPSLAGQSGGGLYLTRSLTASGDSATHGVSGLDLSTLMKAAAAITSTLDLDELVTRLLNLLVENTGATHGVMALPSGDSWIVVGTVDVSQSGSHSAKLALEDCDQVCPAAVRLAARRGHALVVDEVAADPRFRLYGEANQVQSMLVVPIVQQGAVAGVVYFEHREAAHAFTPERVSFVELLASQAAIGVENARLHQDLAQAFAVQVALNEAHRRFVPQRFLDGLGRDSIADVALGDAIEKNMTILFSDIRAFTSLIEGMAAAESIDFINQYLSHMEPAIHQNAGFVDSYIGDAIMALFEGATDGALRAAVEMLRRLETFNQTRVSQGQVPIRMGIGLAHGPVMMGTIGGENRLKCGVIGDSVNLGARLETLTKQYDVDLFISGRVRRGLADVTQFQMRLADRVQVKGKHETVEVWEVFDADAPALREAKAGSLVAHERGMACFYARDFAGAVTALETVFAALPSDRLVEMQLERARQLAVVGVSEDWDGTQRMEKK